MTIYISLSLVLAVLLRLVADGDALSREVERVEIDLKYGWVRGYSKHVHFMQDPRGTARGNRKCSNQAVIRLNLTGPYKLAKFQLDYADRPRLWTLDISDSPTGDGNGGDGGTTSNNAEVQIYNRQLRVYSNALPGHKEAAIDGNTLMKVEDNVVKKGTKMFFEVSNERIDWYNNRKKKDFIGNKFLFTLDGQPASRGINDSYLYAAFNRVVMGTYREGTGLCKVTVTLHKTVNECLDGTADCHKNAKCMDTRKSFQCTCKPGYYGSGKICRDENECESLQPNGGCVHRCTNTDGNYSCGCLRGFELDKDAHNCIDINECFKNKGNCDHQCVNTLGSYECRCNSGYSLRTDERTCSPGDWCIRNLGCAHFCVSGSKCGCRQGYRFHPNMRDCILTCSVGNGGCQHICEDLPTGPNCSCVEKYKLNKDRKTCIATCGVNNGGCDGICKDSETGPICSCSEGYFLHQDKKTCVDIDECLNNNGGCSHGCYNTDGSFDCTCPLGYKVQGDEVTCKDVDECLMNTTCDHICENTASSFRCHCRKGYQSYGITHCGDVNECSINNGGCQHTCINQEGTMECRCKKGYRLHTNGKDCIELSKCLPLRAPPKAILSCSKKVGNVESCSIACHQNAFFSSSLEKHYTYTCGTNTKYYWSHEVKNLSLPSCSESVFPPHVKRKAKFLFTADKCRLRKKNRANFKTNFSKTMTEPSFSIIAEKGKFHCTNRCQIIYVNLQCGSKRRKWRHLGGKNQAVITAEFEIQISPTKPSGRCNIACVKRKTEKKLKKTLRVLRKSINKESFYVRFDGHEYQVARKTFKTDGSPKLICPLGHILIGDKCIACSVGSYFEPNIAKCMPCHQGYYQDKEGQLACKQCPPKSVGHGIMGAINVSQCGGQCPPGYYSTDGYQPCMQCPWGTYQPEPGHTWCLPCGMNLNTNRMAATGFQDCRVAVVCAAGYYYHKNGLCRMCPRGKYQPRSGQNYCIDCPGNTLTDIEGATNSSECKAQECGGGVIAKYRGYIETPNYPGKYPKNSKCTWSIDPGKGRRILLIIPEIFLADGDKCGDQIIMRKSASPYSLPTWQKCSSNSRPTAFTARSRKLWIQFKSDGQNSAKGFSIPYVTYDENYQLLIEDIVRDGRLYNSHQHQKILKDRKLLSSLMEVIALPRIYLSKYVNMSSSLLPSSFLHLMHQKVTDFFGSG